MKAFIAYRANPVFLSSLRADADIGGIEGKFMSRDPSAGQWSTMGLVGGIDGDDIHSLEGGHYVLTMQINDRILPGKVRDEELAKAIVKIENMEGRKVTKKEFRQLRDQVEFDMLPKAFIRRTVVPIVVMRSGAVFVCTASAKRADGIVLQLAGMYEGAVFTQIATKDDPGSALTTLATRYDRDSTCEGLEPTSNAVLKGEDEDKRTIRVKDADILSHDVQQVLKQGYRVRELGLAFLGDQEDEPKLTFTLTDSLIFKSVKLPGVIMSEHKDDAHGLAYLAAKTFEEALQHVMGFMGGERKPQKSKQDEDDEL